MASGAMWEQRALDFLAAEGLTCIARNFHTRLGEIDLIMLDADCLVFVEVRKRRPSRFGGGLQSVHPKKQQRLLRSAALFLKARPEFKNSPCRFDVIAYDTGDDDSHLPLWVKRAFSAG